MKQAIFTFLFVFLPILASADTVEIDGIYYNLNEKSKTAEVTWGNNLYSGDTIIPETISYDGVVYDVTSIGYYAFGGDKDLISVVIPNSVTSIGNSAFSGCEGLITIDIPNSVTSIGHEAFDGSAWYNNQPDGLVYGGKVLYKYKGEMPENTNVSLKDGTIGISDFAFLQCKGLISIDIPSSVKYIGIEAFGGCSGLTSVTIPNSVSSIGIRAFYFCSSLSNIEIPNSVTYIGWFAFDGTAWYFNQQDGVIYAGKFAYGYKGVMPENTNITLKDGTFGIVDNAFSARSSLTSIYIPNSVTTIGENVFSYCSGLTSVIIPYSVTSIGSYAFLNCSGLKSVSIPNSVKSISNGTFMDCRVLTSIDIPNSVTSIGFESFKDCRALASVIIPNSVTSICESAFGSCKNLSDVYCYAELPPSTDVSFADIELSQSTLHVPAASINLYRNAIEWEDFGNIVALTDDDPKPTAINSLKEYSPTYPVGIYSIDGKRLQKEQRGLNIIRMNDGKTIKRIVK